MIRKHYILKSVYKFILNFNIMKPEENLSPDQKKTWSTVLKFAVELIKLIIASFLGGSASTLIS